MFQQYLFKFYVNATQFPHFKTVRLNPANTETIKYPSSIIYHNKSNKINDILGSDRQARTIPC